MMSSFVQKLTAFALLALLAILVVHHVAVGRPRAKMQEAANFAGTFLRSALADPRFANIENDGISWSGPGHPIYIPLGGSVRSVEDWIALSNRVVLARPPVEVIFSTVRIDPQSGLGSPAETIPVRRTVRH